MDLDSPLFTEALVIARAMEMLNDEMAMELWRALVANRPEMEDYIIEALEATSVGKRGQG